MRKATFSTKAHGTYVTTYQRPGEPVMLDLAFFDGDRSIKDAKHHRDLLTKAIDAAERWEKERKP